MKFTCIHLGILVTLFSNSISANDLTNKQNYQESNSSEFTFMSLSNDTKFKKPALAFEPDTIITISANYIKTIEEVIAEDNKIIESDINTNANLEMETTVKEGIKHDNQIIESNLTNEVFPLDFNRINRAIANVLQT